MVNTKEEDEFTKRIVSFAAVAFVPSLLLSVAVFPPSDEDWASVPHIFPRFEEDLDQVQMNELTYGENGWANLSTFWGLESNLVRKIEDSNFDFMVRKG